jgi:hypothetical protein
MTEEEEFVFSMEWSPCEGCIMEGDCHVCEIGIDGNNNLTIDTQSNE